MRRRQNPTQAAPDRAHVHAVVARYLCDPRDPDAGLALADLAELAGGRDVGEMLAYFIARNTDRGADALTDYLMDNIEARI